MAGQLRNKIAIITGGARGIGEASVRRFVEEGARVVIADILDARAQALADELGEAAVFHHTDVCYRQPQQHQSARLLNPGLHQLYGGDAGAHV